MTFELYIGSEEFVKERIRECEGKHIQQVSYSTYHNALTQICFNCEVIRTSLPENHIYRGGRLKGKDKNKVSPISASATERNDKESKAHSPLKITTKGFDFYKYKNNTGEWFSIGDTMSEEDLIDSIKQCVEIDKTALDSLNEIYENHFELCSKLNELMDNIPDKTRDKIWDLVYKHFEP